MDHEKLVQEVLAELQAELLKGATPAKSSEADVSVLADDVDKMWTLVDKVLKLRWPVEHGCEESPVKFRLWDSTKHQPLAEWVYLKNAAKRTDAVDLISERARVMHNRRACLTAIKVASRELELLDVEDSELMVSQLSEELSCSIAVVKYNEGAYFSVHRTQAQAEAFIQDNEQPGGRFEAEGFKVSSKYTKKLTPVIPCGYAEYDVNKLKAAFGAQIDVVLQKREGQVLLTYNPHSGLHLLQSEITPLSMS